MTLAEVENILGRGLEEKPIDIDFNIIHITFHIMKKDYGDRRKIAMMMEDDGKYSCKYWTGDRGEIVVYFRGDKVVDGNFNEVYRQTRTIWQQIKSWFHPQEVFPSLPKI